MYMYIGKQNKLMWTFQFHTIFKHSLLGLSDLKRSWIVSFRTLLKDCPCTSISPCNQCSVVSLSIDSGKNETLDKGRQLLNKTYILLVIMTQVSNDSVSRQWRPWSDYAADAQADLDLRCLHMPKDTFSHDTALVCGAQIPHINTCTMQHQSFFGTFAIIGLGRVLNRSFFLITAMIL